MKFLTRAWHSGEYPDEEVDALLKAYRAHRADVLPRLPMNVRSFAETADIHDGTLRAVLLDRASGELRLELRCGDNQQGYFDLDLVYHRVRMDRLDVPVLEVIARDQETEALYLEVDIIDPGWYVHRWLWWPFRRELDIEFSDLTFNREPRPGREFTPSAPPFLEIRSPAG